MYKSQLQEYAQKAGLMHPTYDHVKEGASHEPRFKSTVWVNNQSYESPPGFPTLRSAEHAAAKVALDFLQNTQTKGVVPSPVHESGLCKNLLQEFAQKNGYPLPQYKIMRQGEEHSLVFTATVEIAGVSYSGGGGKSKKEAEIKAARTALLAIQASQPATGVGLPAVEPRPLAQPPAGQITNFMKSHQKKKKRGRTTPVLPEEPHAIRVKQGLGQVGGPVQLQQMHQVHPIHPMHPVPQVSQVSHTPHMMHVPPMNQLPQPYSVNTVGFPGQSVLPVEWNQELGVSSRPAAVYSESMQVGNFMQQDTTMTQSAWNPVAPHGTEPTLNTPAENNLTTASGHTETAVVETQVATAKTEPAAVQQAPLEEHTVSLVTTEVKETITVTESHVSSVSTAEVVSVEPQISVPVEVTEELGAAQVSAVLEPVSGTTTKTPVSGAPQEPHTVTNGELQAEIMRPMDFGIKSEAA